MDKEKLIKIKDVVLDKVKNTKILGIIGVIIAVIGLFLPFAKVDYWFIDESISYIQGDGVFILIFCIITAVLIFSDIIAEKWSKGRKVFSKLANPKVTLIPSILSVIILIISIANYGDVSDYVTYSIGFYVIWIGIILTIAYAFLYKKPEEIKEKSNEEPKE